MRTFERKYPKNCAVCCLDLADFIDFYSSRTRHLPLTDEAEGEDHIEAEDLT